MTSWSPQDVRVDGTSLKTFAYGIVLDSPLESMPKRRGGNQEIAYLRGNRWRPKYWEPEVRTLTIWIDSRLPDGTFPGSDLAAIAQRNANVRSLIKLFTPETREVTIARDVLLPSGVETWSALCEVVGGIVVTGSEDFPDLAGVDLELSFADPFWYGPAQTINITGTTVVTNPGEATAWDTTVAFNGASTNPVLYNDTLGSNLSLATTTIAGGNKITLIWRTTSAIRQSDSANMIAVVRQNGSREWMLLAPGANSMRLTGGGSVDLSFRPPRI